MFKEEKVDSLFLLQEVVLLDNHINIDDYLYCIINISIIIKLLLKNLF